MKVFQVFNEFVYRHFEEFQNLADTVGKFAPNIVFVEAPDYVFEGWGYDETKEGDDRFIKPEPPEGFVYDEDNGTFFPESLIPEKQRIEYEGLVQQKIRGKYTMTDEFKVLREALANPDDEATQAAFAEYNEHVITCKEEAHKEVYGYE